MMDFSTLPPIDLNSLFGHLKNFLSEVADNDKVQVALLTITVLFALFVAKIYSIYDERIGGTRLARNNKACPSNKEHPDIKGFKENRDRILENSDLYPENFGNCELLHHLHDEKPESKHNSVITDRAERFRSVRIKNFDMSQLDDDHISGKTMYQGSLSKEKADELDMDHVYITFKDFLWAHLAIGPNAYFLWKKNLFFFRIRKYLVKIGILKAKPVDMAELVGKMCLEQSQVIHYYGCTKGSPKIAGFFFADFPYINKDMKYEVADLFAVDIDLTTKKMVKAKLDDQIISPSKALILLWFNTIAAQHVKLHALANWGVNSDPSLKAKNPFFHRNSVVTTMYNYFGYTCFHTYMAEWERQGLLSPGYSDGTALLDCFNHGIKQNIWQHQNIEELVKYSEFVHFIVKVRSIFMSEFQKYKHLFPGVHGEAMFVGTIMHSLDHTLMDWNLEDPLWLDVDDPEFGKMAEMGRIVKMGFVADVPFLYFQKRYKGSGHPFYESVYAKAAKVNKKLADMMDTCIIK